MSDLSGDSPLIYLIAGEPSGDLLGGALMVALKQQGGERLRFAGIGGEAMAEQGLESLFPIEDLAVMGIFEIVPQLPTILRRLRETVAAVRAAKPSVVVTIDSPGFSLEVAERLKAQGIGPLVHMVAPSVWAWKPWRARQIARYLDRLLCLLPFEPPYFERHGLATTFIGHPAVEQSYAAEEGRAFRARHGLPSEGELLAVLPGSRRSELEVHLPIFEAALRGLAGRHPTLAVIVPSVAARTEAIRAATAHWPLPTQVVSGAEEKRGAFAAATLALAKSGTGTLELAVAGVPTVIAYRLSGLGAHIPHSWAKVPYVGLANLVLNRPMQPEFVQRACRPGALAGALDRLLVDPAARRAQVDGAAEAVARLNPGPLPPSGLAAQAILRLLAAGGPAQAAPYEATAKEARG
ncbi:MAG: lipid-A-disaccharide synthase [Kiloniellales bacterium]